MHFRANTKVRLDARHSLIRRAVAAPEFAMIPESSRERIAETCMREFNKSGAARLCEALFGVLLCLSVGIGLTVGYFLYGFAGALAVMAVCVTVTSFLCAYLGHFLWRRFLRKEVPTRKKAMETPFE
jgi:hypothetical protein